MIRLLAVDPGKNGLALSTFRDGEYFASSLLRLPKNPLLNTAKWLDDVRVYDDYDICVVEEMTYYPQAGSAKASSEIAALLQLQAIGGLVAGFSGAEVIQFVPARIWKGQLPKEICHARIASVLSSKEIVALSKNCSRYPKSLQHNILDSVGIGLHYLKRGDFDHDHRLGQTRTCRSMLRT